MDQATAPGTEVLEKALLALREEARNYKRLEFEFRRRAKSSYEQLNQLAILAHQKLGIDLRLEQAQTKES